MTLVRKFAGCWLAFTECCDDKKDDKKTVQQRSRARLLRNRYIHNQRTLSEPCQPVDLESEFGKYPLRSYRAVQMVFR